MINNKKMRRIMMGLSTIFGVKDNGWFIPYRYKSQTPKPENFKYHNIESLFSLHESGFKQLLQSMSAYTELVQELTNAKPPLPRFQQTWYPGIDALFAYTLIRQQKPQKIIEIGSGHSTRFFAKAISDERLLTSLLAIDPAPRADIAKLDNISFIQKPLQQVDLSVFKELKEGDILAIDSSHIVMPASDVDILFNQVIPSLPKGVIVQVHDIFLPDDYPDEWQWRGYNEQQLLPSLLRQGAKLLWSSHYVRSRMSEEIIINGLDGIPLAQDAKETALWLELV